MVWWPLVPDNCWVWLSSALSRCHTSHRDRSSGNSLSLLSNTVHGEAAVRWNGRDARIMMVLMVVYRVGIDNAGSFLGAGGAGVKPERTSPCRGRHPVLFST
jgi:hypothetical protein